MLPLAVSGVLALAGCAERPDGGRGEGVRAASQALQGDPDLVISAVSGPPSVMPWGDFEASVTVCNEGESPSYGVNVEIHLSEDADVTGADPFVGSGGTPYLEPGQCASLNLPAFVQEPGVVHLGAIVDPYDQTPEAEEGNNAAAGGLIVVGWGPDLVVSAVSGPPSALSGSALDVAVTVCNQGTASSYGSSAEVWLSADDEITPSDQLLGTAWLGPLEAAECLEIAVPASLYAPDGAYHLGAVLDAQDFVEELIETNNSAAAGDLIGLGWAPDVVVAAVSGPPSAMPGSGFIVSATVCNQGTAPLNGAQVAARLSDDDEITELDDLLGTAWISSLDAGQCAGAEINTGAWVPEGAYRLGAIASAGAGAELIESNNAAAGDLIGIGGYPDLIVSAVSAPPSVVPGGSFDVAVTLCNQGTTPAYGTGVEVRLSTDAGITLTDPLVGSSWTGYLDAGQCADLVVPAHASVSDAVYRVGAIADPYGNVDELLEANNALAGGQLGVGWAPDLVVASVSGPPSATAGTPFNVTTVVCNQGTEPSSGAYLQVRLSTDAAISELDPPLGGGAVPPLEVGQCASVVVQAQAYGPDGVYRIGAIVMGGNELNTSNNTAVDELMGVGWAPDVVIAAVSGPPSAMPGSGFIVSATVCNQGTALLNGAQIVARLSADDTISELDQPLGLAWVNALDAGQCAEVEIQAGASAPEGAYRLGAIAFAGGGVELVGSNNAAAGDLIGIGGYPDLIVTAVSAPPSVVPGGNFEVAVTLCNQGTTPAYGTGVEVRLSTDAGITLTDPLVGSSWTGYLDAGQCADLIVPAHASVNDAVYRVGAIADPYGNVDELLEANNALAGGPLGVGWAPDLVVASVSGPPSTTAGTPFDVTAVVCNQGTEPSSGAHLQVRLSTDAAISPFDPPLGGAPVPPLEVGQCASVVVQTQAYGPDGVYRIGAIVMGGYELNTSNNTAVDELIGLGWAPDVVIAAVSGPPSAMIGSGFIVSATVCNQGTAPLNGAQVVARLSADDTITELDQPLGLAWVSALDAGQCAEVEIQAGASTPEGAYRLGAIASAGSGVELVESNNAAAGDLIGIGGYPDLIVTAVSAPPSVVPGGNFDVAVTLCNQGTTPAYGTGVEVRLSTDAGITLADPLVGSSWTGYLDAGQCADLVVPAHASVNDAVYRVGAIADPYGNVHELLEANNALAGGPLAVGWAPDLVIASVSGPPSTTAGTPFNVTAEICNQGTEPSSGAHLQVRLSTDAAISQSDPPLGGAPVPPIGVGQCASVVVQTQAYGPDGVYRIGAIVMGGYELNTSNNTAAAERLGLGWAPDVVVAAVSGPPSAMPGSGFIVSATVCNQGTAPLNGAQVAARLSADDTITELDQPLGTAWINALDAGQCAEVEIHAGASAPEGAYRLGAIAFAGGSVELVGSNNAAAGNQIGIGGYPDLIISAVSAPPSVAPGGNFDVAVTLCNQGTTPAYGTGVEVRLSTDAGITLADSLVGTSWTGYLDAGQCADLVVPAHASVNDAVYRVGVIADPYGNVHELLEANNGLAGGPLGVGWAPDLVIASVSGPPSTTAGTPFNVTAVICNQGTEPSSGAHLEMRLSSDAAISPVDPPLGGAPVPPIDVGQCASVVVQTQAYGPDGAYRIGAIVMGGYELTTSNNSAMSAPFGMKRDQPPGNRAPPGGGGIRGSRDPAALSGAQGL